MIHGVLNIYKEKGYTSHDVVAKLRGIVGQKKIGHTGTLDPDAQGVLPVCLGKATKLCGMLTDKDKTYEAVLLLGVSTDTQDVSGKVLEEKSTQFLTEEIVQKAVFEFEGEYQQVPPMYSALKVNGKKLYELAREGKEVKREARKVTIHNIRILEIDLPRVKMEVKCSKGTYIRTLCHDIGQILQTGGCMESLLRTQVGIFRIADSVHLEEVRKWNAEGCIKDKILAIDDMFSQYRKIYLKSTAAQAVRNGNGFRAGDILWAEHLEEVASGEHVLVYDEKQNFIAVYEYQGKLKSFKIVKMFFDKLEEE